MVRAPPCHGGSCGFEPRLPRIFIAFLLGVFSFFFACSNQSFDIRQESKHTVFLLIKELQQIRSRDDLVEHAPRLQELFNRLVDAIIHAKEYKKNHPEFEVEEHCFSEQSDLLRVEMNRILRMEGGQEVLEKVQAPGLRRLENS